MIKKKLLISCLGFVLAVGLSSAQAGPILDTGWDYDQIDFAATPSLESPYVFVLATPAYFRITDYFVVGDTYFVSDFGAPILTTSLDGAHPSLVPIGDPLGDAGWTDASFQHGEILLSAGAHSLVVTGDGAGGLPAGFYTRLDTAKVPEPGSLMVLGLGLLALNRFRRRLS